MAIAGKVAITLSTENGGEWSADVSYDRLVAVKHNNNLYISRTANANTEPTANSEVWFLALEGFGGDDVESILQAIENIINGTTQVGNAKTLDGHGEEYFAPKTDLANYLPLTGGTVKSLEVDFDTASKFQAIPYGGETYLRNLIDSNNYQDVLIKASNLVYQTVTNGVAKENTLLHTGNKPTGAYTGNEDATERTISTGGTGNVVIIYSSYGVAIVTTNISLLIGSDGSVTKSNDVSFASDGVILIKTNNKIVNGLGTLRYTYV